MRKGKDMVSTLHPSDSLSSYRSCLTVVCQSITQLTRVDCTTISSSKLGRFRLLGVISTVEQGVRERLELLRGVCQECGKLDRVEMFEQRGSDIFCCKRGRVTLPAKKILQVVFYVYDQTNMVGEGVKLVVRDREAELFLECSTKQFIVDRKARDMVEKKILKLQGTMGDFGVEKCESGTLLIVESRIK